MEPDKKPDELETPAAESQPQDAPADALSRTPDDLADEEAHEATASSKADNLPEEKKISPLRRVFRRVNVYFLLFILLVGVVGIITVVNYLNSQKAPVEPGVDAQSLSQNSLKQLANTDVSVGSSSQTLTIQGNAVISGQTLMRGDLNVAGNFQSSGSITGPSIKIAGDASLGKTQANSLQVQQDLAVQGNTTMRDLSVAGAASFSGATKVSQLTVSRLTLSGNAVLQVPNHLSFTGPTPSRSNGSALGSGGSASVNGSDTSGTVNIRTGNNPSAGCFAKITFRQAFSARPRVIVSPVGNAAGKTQYYVDRDNSGFSICTANAAPGNQTFAFDYFVAG
ncbi:MAG TPA: hypothetical protein VGE34_03815 [Candidatus Saccharimonadales bacterium]